MSMGLLSQLEALLKPGPLMVGTVTGVGAGSVTVALPGGGSVTARGDANVGQSVFVRDGVIEGDAPNLPSVTVTV